LIRNLCGRLVGVDLSPKMLALARSRGCYDELVAAELSAFMRSRPSSFNAIVCADTLVYFGALDDPLGAAHQALRPSGTLIFTAEALTEGSQAEDFRLELSGRYVHAESYLRGTLAASGFWIDSILRETLREERSENVAGHVVVARRN
jgi:predicted TPR repeat methyltransferase